jgi:hypothetical protein
VPQSPVYEHTSLISNSRVLELLIEDIRTEPANKFIRELLLDASEELPTGEWLVNGNDLLRELQKSPSSLDGWCACSVSINLFTHPSSGPVKLALEDLHNAGWKRYFTKISGLELLSDATTSPVQLKVSADCRLKIFVEDAEVSHNYHSQSVRLLISITPALDEGSEA